MSYEVVWTVREEAKLRRQLELFSRHSGLRISAGQILQILRDELRAHPLEWPTSEREPEEHTWRFGRLAVRYRVIPSCQMIEVLEVTNSPSRR